jgi:glycolate oxidase
MGPCCSCSRGSTASSSSIPSDASRACSPERRPSISQAPRHRLFYAPDLIAGRLHDRRQRRGELGGVHCLKYGLTFHNVLELELVTVDGSATIGAESGDAAGLPLIALVCGSEGMLGVSSRSPCD